MKTKIVAVVIFKEGEKVLIQDRKPWDKYGYDYGFFGGKIKQGENPEQTLKRELKEELEIDINLKDFKFVKHCKKQIPEIDLEIEYYLYVSKIPNLKKINCKEGKPVLIKIDDALKLRFNPGDKEILEEIR
jgi:8-oxo-dGTP diphosphatase